MLELLRGKYKIITSYSGSSKGSRGQWNRWTRAVAVIERISVKEDKYIDHKTQVQTPNINTGFFKQMLLTLKSAE
jgi:hypothetical protein